MRRYPQPLAAIEKIDRTNSRLGLDDPTLYMAVHAHVRIPVHCAADDVPGPDLPQVAITSSLSRGVALHFCGVVHEA